MKVGDLVKWVGWGISQNQGEVGIVINVSPTTVSATMAGRRELRYDVLWGGGKIGKRLYMSTLEVVQ